MQLRSMLMLLCLFLGISFAAVPYQAYAATQQSTAPSVFFNYTLRPRQFTVRIRNVKQVAYTITYKRSGGKLIEALSGGGRVKNGTYARVHFAGSQSSKYFIPHNVLSGTIDLSGIDLHGNNIVYKRNFMIRNGKLVYTK